LDFVIERREEIFFHLTLSLKDFQRKEDCLSSKRNKERKKSYFEKLKTEEGM
jgi:hypothetical protein